MYVVKCLRRSRGQRDNLEPFILSGPYTRLREAKGECKAQRNSLGELLMQKYETSPLTLYYFEWKSYYVFTLEDADGIDFEAHIYLDDVPD